MGRINRNSNVLSLLHFYFVRLVIRPFGHPSVPRSITLTIRRFRRPSLLLIVTARPTTTTTTFNTTGKTLCSKMCTAGQRLSLTVTGPGPSFFLSFSSPLLPHSLTLSLSHCCLKKTDIIPLGSATQKGLKRTSKSFRWPQRTSKVGSRKGWVGFREQYKMNG